MIDDRTALRVLTVLAPVKAGQVGAIATRLGELDRGPSPFSRSDRTHFARLLILPEEQEPQTRPRGMRRRPWLLDLVTHFGRAQRQDRLPGPYLVLSATYDDPDGDANGEDHSSYLEHLRQELGADLDVIFDGCEGYPGRDDAATFRAYVAACSTPAAYVFTPPEKATAAQVKAALQLRRQVARVAVDTQYLPDDALRQRFDELFTRPAEPSLDDPAVPRPGSPILVEALDEAMEWNVWAREDAKAYPRRGRARASRRRPDLTDVQGLTVGYPTHNAGAFLLLRVLDPAAARAWLGRTPVTTAAHAHAVLDDTGRGDEPRSTAARDLVARHVAISHAGLERLGVSADALAGFDRGFRAGMAAREHALAPGTGTTSWQQPYPAADGGVHVLVHLSALDADHLDRALAELRTDLARNGGVVEVGCERAHRLGSPTPSSGSSDSSASTDPRRRRHVEHFGFADGLSQPTIVGLERRPKPTALPTGELLLGYADIDGDTSGATAPMDLAFNGCYLVFRKLEQDVGGFRALTGGSDDRGAKLVGRRQNGDPLGPDLDFGRDPDGVQCPVGSHVRRVNPRNSQPRIVASECPAPDDKEPIEPRLARRHRMLRRGMPYGEPWPESDGDRGLLFVALVADIGRQYEFVQTQWMNDGQAFRLGADPDVLAGIGGRDLKVTVQGQPPAFVAVPRALVTCRGGEYFLLPAPSALRRLAG